ncbi:helix-turn-helix transcriptional regulator [Micromonospora peucetia]|uniref:helix-turn-helix transcriptional regulator n=1 Tax=Micromonospora peucetia TaxID=47871 RepID=UPI003328A62E
MENVSSQPRSTRDSALSVVGVDHAAERIYRHLLRTGPISLSELRGVVEMPDRQLRSAVAKLVDTGLVNDSGAAGLLVPRAPELAVAALIDDQERDLLMARQAVREMMSESWISRSSGGPEGPVEVLADDAAMAKRLAEIEAAARREILMFGKAPFVLAAPNTDEVLAVLDRRIECRAVYERTAFDRPGSLQAVTEFMAVGEQVRISDRLPMKLIIVDRAVALLPAGEGHPGRWLVVRGGSLVNAFVALFELIWERSVPFGVAGRGGEVTPLLSEEDVQLLGMLFAGMTDAAIARQVDASVRTVQRRLSGLMARAGVRSRAQLAWQAARAGWLTE